MSKIEGVQGGGSSDRPNPFRPNDATEFNRAMWAALNAAGVDKPKPTEPKPFSPGPPPPPPSNPER